ncbi:unnamed protein product [Aphanomyces euteiches]
MPTAQDQWAWFLVFTTVFLSFYIFTSPFVENRELLDRWTVYVYFSMGLYTWLLSAVAVHVPLTELGMMDYDVKQPFNRDPCRVSNCAVLTQTLWMGDTIFQLIVESTRLDNYSK